MASRSTRNKLRYQLTKCLTGLVKVQGHLQYLSELAGDTHPVINERLPLYVQMIDEIQKLFDSFRDDL